MEPIWSYWQGSGVSGLGNGKAMKILAFSALTVIPRHQQPQAGTYLLVFLYLPHLEVAASRVPCCPHVGFPHDLEIQSLLIFWVPMPRVL